MKTNLIFKTLAAALLVPAMLLTTACSNDDDAISNPENTIHKGYALPATINVTRQGDEATTRATFDGSKLSFSTGDQLFVWGCYDDDKEFAGLLTWQSGGTFSGTIMTETEYTGTFDELLSSADLTNAVLLPAGYETYEFLSISGSGYEATIGFNMTKAFAESKAAAVEQLSLEQASSYSSGFALAPVFAILNFTITGLAASTEVEVNFAYSSITIKKNVTTDGSGTATFAVGIPGGYDLNTCTLTVDGNAITLVSESKTLTAGKIYNITRSVAPAARTLAEATTADHGKVVCAAGHLHNAKTAVPAGCTAVGILGKVTDTGHGLILALQDATLQDWYTINGWTSVTTYAGTTLKLLPDNAARGANLTSYTTLGSTTVSNWAVAQKSDYEAIFKNLGSAKYDSAGYTFDANVNAFITTGVGGTAIYGYCWSATDAGGYFAWEFDSGSWDNRGKDNSGIVWPVLGF